MREVILSPQNYFSWRTLKEAMPRLPHEPHMLVIHRVSWIQMISIELVGHIIPFLGFMLLDDLVSHVSTTDEIHENPFDLGLYYILGFIGIWLILIYLNYDWRDIPNEMVHWAKIFALMALWQEVVSNLSIFPFQMCYFTLVGGIVIQHFIAAFQDIFESFPVDMVGIKIPMCIFYKEGHLMDTQARFDDAILLLLKNIDIHLLKIELDAKQQWKPGMYKDFKRIITIAQSLPKGFVLNVEDNHLFDQLNEEERFNYMVHFQNCRSHLKFENNGISESKNAFLFIVSVIKTHRLPVYLWLEIYSYLFNAQEKKYLIHRYSNHDLSKQFSSFHVYHFMKDKWHDLADNCEAITAISFP